MGSLSVLMLKVPSGEFCIHFLMRLLIISNLIYRATTIAVKLGIEFALIHWKRDGKERDAPEHMEILVGDVYDKVDYCFCFSLPKYLTYATGIQVAILVDDMIDSGNTLTLAARTLKENQYMH